MSKCFFNGGCWVIVVIVLVVVVGVVYFFVQCVCQVDIKLVVFSVLVQLVFVLVSMVFLIVYFIVQVDIGLVLVSIVLLFLFVDSDVNVVDSLIVLVSGSDMGVWLVCQLVILCIVVIVDVLLCLDMGCFILLVKLVKGSLQMDQVNGQSMIGVVNVMCYVFYMQVLVVVDLQVLVDWYVYYYLLFQQVYVEFGYFKVYFNDWLIVVIDYLLVVLELIQLLVVMFYKQGYVFVDLVLQGLLVGQKVMVCIGIVNEVLVKVKLCDLCVCLVGSGLYVVLVVVGLMVK